MNVSRRESLKCLLSTTSAAALSPANAMAADNHLSDLVPERHEERIAWWRAARFGMFVHWGLYSVLGRDAWAMGDEDIPLSDYVELTKHFTPQKDCARRWARLARQAGMKYIVMTTKHHEGFCLFDSRLTAYCAPRQLINRDLVAEFVEAARAEDLRIGFYYSLMDWHHPDWRNCKEDENARRRFIAYTHGQVRELLTQYGKIDILWYDMPIPLDAAGWASKKLNEMVFELQPQILVNNRNRLTGDFSTPEQNLTPADRDWEACMTLNDCWGYVPADQNWKSPHHLVQNLINCSANKGNLLLNIGPRADGSIPEPCVDILRTLGRWIGENGASIYETQRSEFLHGDICAFTRRGNTLYVHVLYWPGEVMTIGGVTTTVLSVKLLASGKDISFTQKGRQLILSDLPKRSPDELITVFAIECQSVPVQHALSSQADKG